jgi:MFS family permease
VTAELGIGRGVLGSALAGGFILTTIGTAILGWLLDHWGTRRVMIPGLLACAGTVALQATLTPNTLWIYFLLGINGLAFSQWFDRERGLALGVALAGVGLGVAIVPQLATFLISHFGWRAGYVGLAVAILIIAWLPVSIFLREPPDFVPEVKRSPVAIADSTAGTVIPGMLARDGFKTWHFWSFTLAFFLAIVAINGTLTQVVALLTDRGISVGLAVSAMSASGIALIFGRILSGWCLDRFWGPYVAVVFFLLPMAGIALLIGGGGTVPLAGAVLCGLGIGADVDLMAFFVSRYFGMKEYAKLYGVMLALFSLANGVGPALSGLSFDYFHGYTQIFIVYEILLVIACAQFLGLGAYPYPARDEPAVA